MRWARLCVVVGVAGVLSLTGCSAADASGAGAATPSAAAGRPVASVLLTTPKDSYDPLTGRTIASQVLGAAPNGCVTVGGAYLRVGYGSALTEHGRAVGLAGIGVYRLGQRLPALYGYEHTFTEADLPDASAPCGPGRYISSPSASGSSTRRASTLPVSPVERGASTTVNGLLDVAGNGCVRAGGQYVVAPEGSALRDRGAAVHIAGVGTYRIGTWMPTLAARSAFHPSGRVPKALAACGPGAYVTISKRQDQPVLVFDAVDDSTRMVVQPASSRDSAPSRAVSGVIGKRNTCVTIGSVFLSAPHGSTVVDSGRRVHLTGIGTFRIGGDLPDQAARLVTYTERTVPRGLIDCGAGTYAEVRPR